MSTIAYDGKTIAFDTQSGVGNRIDREPWLKIREVDCWEDKRLSSVVDYKYAGGCGVAGLIDIFFRWVKDGAKYDDYPKLCSDGSADNWFIAVTPDGELHEFEFSGDPVVKTRKLDAYGSGGHYALGAMLHGASAAEAVKIASTVDPYTNDDVRSFDLDQTDLQLTQNA